MDNNTSNNVSNNTNSTLNNNISNNTNLNTNSYTGNTVNTVNTGYENNTNSTYYENRTYNNASSERTSGSERNNENDSMFYYARNRYGNPYGSQYGNQYENRNIGSYGRGNSPMNGNNNLSNKAGNTNGQYDGTTNSSAWNNYNKPYTINTDRAQYPNPYGTGNNAGTNAGAGYVNQSRYQSQYQSPYASPYRPQQNTGQYNTNTRYGNLYDNQDVYGLDSYYNSPYYRDKSKKNEKRTLFLALIAVAFIVFGCIGATSLVMSFTESQAAKDIVSLENSIEEKYNIEIKVGAEASTWESGFTIERMKDEKTISRALGYLDDILDRLPEGFIDEVMKGYSDGRYLEINITGAMVQIAGNREVLGLTTYNEDKDVIRLNADIFSWQEYKATVAHELFHVIDFEMEQFDEYSSNIKKWQSCNPKSFTYSYSEGQYSDYTTYGDSIENVYFVSYYSKEDIYEDRAEVFSYLLSTDEDGILPSAYKSSHIQSKVKLLLDEIDNHFKTAKNSDVYWKRWYN